MAAQLHCRIVILASWMGCDASVLPHKQRKLMSSYPLLCACLQQHSQCLRALST